MNYLLRTIPLLLLAGISLLPSAAFGDCSPDRIQASGAIYRICMPPSGKYNHRLVMWAPGFQTAGTAVAIPEDLIEAGGVSLPDLANSLGFAFATTGYSKTGLAVRQGMADVVDLVNLFHTEQGAPEKIYLAGASQGGLVAALLAEQHPEVFSSALAVCAPVGDFADQMQYLWDALATFQYLFPTLIPGDPLNPTPDLIDRWPDYYATTVKPALLAPANRKRLKQWAKTAKLAFDPKRPIPTLENTARQVLGYAVMDLQEASATLGGSPFDNIGRQYRGVPDKAARGRDVTRVAADATALAEIRTNYDTSGRPGVPLITAHTSLDPLVPYRQAQLYLGKTRKSKSYLKKHINIRVNRYGHCNLTRDEVLLSFAALIVSAGDARILTGLDPATRGSLLRLALKYRLPF